MPFSENILGPEKVHRLWSSMIGRFANGFIKPGFDGDPPTEFYTIDDVSLRQDTPGPAGVRLVPPDSLAATTGTPTLTHFLRGDQRWVNVPRQYIALERSGVLGVNTAPVFEFTLDETVVWMTGRARLKTAPGGADATFDIMRNGSSMASAGKLTISAGTNRGSLNLPATLGSYSVAGDHIQFTVLTTGTSPNGSDLSLQWSYIPVPDFLP